MVAVEWVTPEDNYVCPLSRETQELAKQELREDKNSVEQALKQIRDWIKLNPRIENCRLGKLSSYSLQRFNFTKVVSSFRRSVPPEVFEVQKVQRTHGAGSHRALPSAQTSISSSIQQFGRK